MALQQFTATGTSSVQSPSPGVTGGGSLGASEYWDSVQHFYSYGLVKWDTSTLPAGAIVSAVTAYFWTTTLRGPDYPANPWGVYFYEASGAWDPSTVNWSTKPATGAYAGQISGNVEPSYSGSPYFAGPEQYLALSLSTAYANAWRTANNGFLAILWSIPFGYGISWAAHGTSGVHPPLLNVTYTFAPSAPGAITSPAIGSVFGASYGTAVQDISWGAASDADTATGSLQYEISLSVNGGGAWSVIVPLTSAGVTTYSYNFANVTSTSQARIRVRAKDPDGNYGSYVTQSGDFTINNSREGWGQVLI